MACVTIIVQHESLLSGWASAVRCGGPYEIFAFKVEELSLYLALLADRVLKCPSSPRVLLPRFSSAVEPRRIHDRIAQVYVWNSAVRRGNNPVHLINHNTSARTRCTALHIGHHATGRRPGPIPQSQVSNIELGRVAVATRGIIARALRHSKDPTGIPQHEVLQCHICCIPQPTATTIGRISTADASPGLEVGTIPHVVDGDVASSDVFDNLIHPIILTNAADRNAQAGVEVAVFDEDVRTVGFRADGIVPIVDSPSTEGNVIRVNSVSAVGVEGGKVEADLLFGVGRVDIYPLEKDVLGMDDSHGPHLALHEADRVEDAVLRSRDGDLVWPAWVVVGAVDEVVPVSVNSNPAE